MWTVWPLGQAEVQQVGQFEYMYGAKMCCQPHENAYWPNQNPLAHDSFAGLMCSVATCPFQFINLPTCPLSVQLYLHDSSGTKLVVPGLHYARSR
jgi:hypothetical protein